MGLYKFDGEDGKSSMMNASATLPTLAISRNRNRMQTFGTSFIVSRVAIWLEFGILAHANFKRRVQVTAGRTRENRDTGLSKLLHTSRLELLFRMCFQERGTFATSRCCVPCRFYRETEDLQGREALLVRLFRSQKHGQRGARE